MSSNMKDARWELATEILEIVGLEFADLDGLSGLFQTVLDTAQALLDTAPEQVEPLAALWSERGETSETPPVIRANSVTSLPMSHTNPDVCMCGLNHTTRFDPPITFCNHPAGIGCKKCTPE